MRLMPCHLILAEMLMKPQRRIPWVALPALPATSNVNAAHPERRGTVVRDAGIPVKL